MNTKFTLFIVLFSFFAIQLFAQSSNTFVKIGDDAPDFSITMPDGSVKKLSDLKGKVVWVNFFANWCGPCRDELPHLEKDVFEKYKARNDFEIMVIGRQHDWGTVNKFKKENNYKMAFYPDEKREIYSKYAKLTIPRNFIIDKEGKIALTSMGYTEKEFAKVKAKVESLLSE